MLYLEKRKSKTKSGETKIRYYIRGTCPYTGEDVRESTKTSDRSAAADILAIRLQKRRERGLHGDKGVATFAECVVHYLQQGGEDRFLDPILDTLGTTKMGDITDKMISDFATAQYPTAKPATVVRQVYGPIEAVWNSACEATPPLAIPRTFNKPKIPKRAAKYAKHDQHLEAVLAAIKRPARKAGILFMSFSGARATEVCRILVEDYDPEASTITLQKTKNEDARVVALPDFVNEACAKLNRDEPKASLFDFPSRFELYKTLKRASKRAKVDFLSPHKIGRHTFAARFLKNGNSLAALKEAGGWRSVNSVMVYAHLEKKDVDAAMRNVKTPLRKPSTAVTPDGTVVTFERRPKKSKR